MIKKIFYTFCLLMVSCGVFADSSIPSALSGGTDQSIGYLAALFGQVGTSLPNIGGGGEMMTALFFKFNQGVIIAAVAVLIYTALMTATRVGIEGQLNTPNRVMYMVGLRLVLGFSVLMPINNGYNLAQRALMQVVTAGVSVADMAWDAALDYINSGGAVFIDSSALTGGNGITSSEYKSAVLGADVGKSSVVSNIVKAEMCMYYSQMNLANEDYQYLQPQVGTDTINFPSRGNTAGDNGCGSVDINTLLNSKGAPNDQVRAATNVVETLLPAAKSAFCRFDASSAGDDFKKHFNSFCSGTVAANAASNVGSVMSDAFLGYSADIQPAIRAATAGAGGAQRAFVGEAKKAGWAGAGSYFWSMLSVQDNALKAAKWAEYANAAAVKSPNPEKDPLKTLLESSSVKDTLNKGLTNAHANIAKAVEASSKGAPGAATASAWKSAGSGAMSAASAIPLFGQVVSFIYDLGKMANIIDPSSSLGNAHPLLMLHNLGIASINTAGDLFFGVLLAALLVAIPTAICQATVNLFSLLDVALKFLTPLVLVIAAALVGVGVFLAYYVPIYPAIIWIFGLLGWLIAVIEGMAAMPLVAMGMTYPEGHDLLGKSEQATMLALALFVRPVSMIIGMVAAMVLSFVSYRMVNYSFGLLLNNLYSYSDSHSLMAGITNVMTNSITSGFSPFGSLMLLLVSFPCMLIIFASLIWVVTQQCYSLVHVIPENLIKWIGGPSNISSMVNPMQMANQVGGSVQSAGGEIGSAMRKQTKAIGKNASEMLSKKKQDSPSLEGEVPSTFSGTDGDGGGDDASSSSDGEGTDGDR